MIALQAFSFMAVGAIVAAVSLCAVRAEIALHRLEEELIDTSKETKDGAIKVCRDKRGRLRIEALIHKATRDPSNHVTRTSSIARPRLKVANLAPDYLALTEENGPDEAR